MAGRSIGMWSRLRSWRVRSDVSMFFNFVPAPHGGAHQFMRALWAEFEARGLRVANNVTGPTTRACLYNSYNFDAARLRAAKPEGCRFVHRVDGPIGLYRGEDDAIDRRICELNWELADATVFQSTYSLEKHLELGMTFKNPTVIPNAVDARIFNPTGRLSFDPNRKIRLISTSWSDNPNKGATTYAWLEAHLDWERYEYTFVGRSPARFARITHLPPMASADLAAVLRNHDVYVTASRHDPCSNALLEALSCGLPAAFLDSGGHRELVKDGGLAFREPEDIPGTLDRLMREYSARQALIAVDSIASVADRYLAVMGLHPGRGERP